ncbi:hypothetical protein A3Q56_05827 [Intoshia linei]|uniref:tRNA pseudouridine(55) synthase n=1 Tax=Intoshia linei TaxID=1819745 RepID=A0A177AWT3_9BILA|nr:hypothetical protein A3Q56_05827 [Intoshia linei]
MTMMKCGICQDIVENLFTTTGKVDIQEFSTDCQICCNIFKIIQEKSNIQSLLDSTDYEFFSNNTYAFSIKLPKNLINIDESYNEIILVSIKKKIAALLQNDLLKYNKNFSIVDIESAQIILHCEFNCPDVCKFYLSRNRIFIAGRYNKYNRCISQSPWKSEKIITSIEEILMGPVKKSFQCQECIFSSSGREDVDVLMLGDGRPFVLEIVDAKIVQVDLVQIQKDITNDHVKVGALSFVSRQQVKELRQIENTTKQYRIYINCFEPVANFIPLLQMGKFFIKQQTPIRVLHTRTNMVRDKFLTFLNIQHDDNIQNCIIVELESQSGTYIKEFVHGDMLRTQPSLKSLLSVSKIDVVHLDVIKVDVEWPPVNSFKQWPLLL